MTAHMWKPESLRSRVYLAIYDAMPRGLTRAELIESMEGVSRHSLDSLLGCPYFLKHVVSAGRGKPYRLNESMPAPPLSIALAAEVLFSEISQAEIGCTETFLRDVTRIDYGPMGRALATLEDAGRIERVEFGRASGWRVSTGGKPSPLDLVIPFIGDIDIDAIHRDKQPESDGTARIDLSGGRLQIRWAGMSIVLPADVTAQTAQYLERYYHPQASHSSLHARSGATA